ncbi:helix-turn-helix transcription factor, AraC type [Mycena rebaudengoi]|nr:helix-turn-helix transcription factor, AraC type [Mycena rebaudengoi]
MFFTKSILLVLSVTAANVAAAPGIIDDITSDLNSIGGDITKGAAGVFETVTSVGGQAVTVVTSAGGEAITLAGSAGGVVTSFAGSQYTIATGKIGEVSGKPGAGVAVLPHMSSALFAGLLTVVASACVGALITV